MKQRRPPPTPPHPELVRTPTGRFGWLEDRLLHDRWLAQLGPDAIAVLVLLALAADRHGASFHGRARMADALGIDLARVDAALDKLTEVRLVASRPWRRGLKDGVWQLLPTPETQTTTPRHNNPRSAAEILADLGFS